MATWTKLRSGEWGVKVQGSARKGQSITVQKKSGETSTVTVEKVVWSGNGVSICAVARKAKTCCVNGQHYRRERGYCYYPCPVRGHICSPENGPCHDCE